MFTPPVSLTSDVAFTFPLTGGELITSTSGWLTSGNTLTGAAPNNPVQRLGANSNHDLILIQNSVPRLILKAEHGMEYMDTLSGFMSAIPDLPLFGVLNTLHFAPSAPVAPDFVYVSHGTITNVISSQDLTGTSIIGIGGTVRYDPTVAGSAPNLVGIIGDVTHQSTVSNPNSMQAIGASLNIESGSVQYVSGFNANSRVSGGAEVSNALGLSIDTYVEGAGSLIDSWIGVLINAPNVNSGGTVNAHTALRISELPNGNILQYTSNSYPVTLSSMAMLGLGTSSPVVMLDIQQETVSNSYPIPISRTTLKTNSAVAGYGIQDDVVLADVNGSLRTASSVITRWNDANDAEQSSAVFIDLYNAGTFSRTLKIHGTQSDTWIANNAQETIGDVTLEVEGDISVGAIVIDETALNNNGDYLITKGASLVSLRLDNNRGLKGIRPPKDQEAKILYVYNEGSGYLDINVGIGTSSQVLSSNGQFLLEAGYTAMFIYNRFAGGGIGAWVLVSISPAP